MKGLELARAFFHEAVAPVVERVAPGMAYTAGRFGPRSDALGFDDDVSRDHGWGPSCELLVEDEAMVAVLDAAMRAQLPLSFRGYSTSFDERYHLVEVAGPPVTHWVEIGTPRRYLRARLGVESAEGLSAIEWLTMDEQKLVEVTAGELFRDDLGFGRTRELLAAYPDDVRLHLMAVEWIKIADEQAFPGRAGSRGDELGAAVIFARLVENAMRLGFYLERRYPPYAKWLGTAYARLAAPVPLDGVLTAPDWQARDAAWGDALRELVARHERAGMLAPGRYTAGPVYAGRPGTGVPDAERLIDEIRAQITDPAVRALPRRLGSLNQMLALRDLEDEAARWRQAIAALGAADRS